jgi:uncharacterized protein YbjT (DUF2867 family)
MTAIAMRGILVAGATGKQGGAVLSSLLSNPGQTPVHLLALTRNADSPRARALAAKPNVSVIQGDMDNVPAIFAQIKEPLYGVFSVQTPLKPKVEERQGKALIDAAAAAGVKHFVYTSADRGGLEKSDRDPTLIHHFASKYNIEKHLLTVHEKHPNMQYTIVRPVAFWDNLTPDFLGRVFKTVWDMNGMDESGRLQFVSSKSIGLLVADIFRKPEEYQGQSISLATDDLTANEANAIFKKFTGKDIPTTYPFVGKLIKWLAYEQFGRMADWFKTDGFGADPNMYLGRIDGMENFETWLKESSGWRDEIRSRK